MRVMLIAVVTAVVLLTASVAFAAGPRWGTAPGPSQGAGAGYGRGAGRGPGSGTDATIPDGVHKAIETATHSAAARVLKMTLTEFEKERAAGKTMMFLAGAKNVPIRTVRTAVWNARKYAINQALAAGKITRAQADALLQSGPRFGTTGGPGAGMRDGRARGGMMHRFGPGR